MVEGDVVLITFPFTNLSGSKLRLAVVLASTSLDLTVCFVTTQPGSGDHRVLLTPSVSNGIREPLLIRTSKIATLGEALARGLLGKLSATEVRDLNSRLKLLLQLS